MASWLAKMGLVVDEAPKKEEVKTAEAAPPIVAQQTTPVVPGSANDDLSNILMEVVKSRVPENAYLKLKDAMDKMMVGNKVDVRSAALGSAALLGLNAETVKNAIAEVITVLVGEQQNYANGDYAKAKAAADQLVARVTEIEGQMDQLLEQVKQLGEEKVATQEAANKAHSEADVASATFNATVSHLSNVLAGEQTKLAAFLS